jgi:hypothetical protein
VGTPFGLIEQVAIASGNPQQIIEQMSIFGCNKWHHDEVVAKGKVFGVEAENVAELHFNYQLGFELEILKYNQGPNWHQQRNPNCYTGPAFLSHMGLHATPEHMEQLYNKLPIAQEVWTHSHSNPAIAGKRKYHYVVFDTRDMFGFDLKLIERVML